MMRRASVLWENARPIYLAARPAPEALSAYGAGCDRAPALHHPAQVGADAVTDADRVARGANLLEHGLTRLGRKLESGIARWIVGSGLGFPFGIQGPYRQQQPLEIGATAAG